jgi:predicted dehydrogenase
MTKPFRVACLGAGYFSRFHYDAWHRIAGATLVASVDQDIAKAKATDLPAYATLETMLADHAPDVIDIITPPATHLTTIRAALDATPRVIICQKPFCADLAEAEEAARLAALANIPLIIHENFRFQPWYRHIKSEIEQGTIGDVLQLTFRLRPGDGQGPDAYLARQPYFQTMERFLIHETGVHFIDTFRYLMGEPAAVMADLRRLNPAIKGEDAGLVVFAYPGGRRATFDGNRLLDHGARNTRCTMGEALVEGTKGALMLFGDGSVHLRRFGQTELEERRPPGPEDGFGGDCVFHLQSHVVAGLNGHQALENTAAEYLPVMRQEAAIYQSSSESRWINLR